MYSKASTPEVPVCPWASPRRGVQLLGLGLIFSMMLHSGAAQAAGPPPRHLAERTLPVPDTVSPQMQEAIAAPVNSMHLQSPRTADEWQALRQVAQRKEQELAQLRARREVAVLRKVIAGVNCYEITPKDILAQNRKRLLVGVHGGGYVFGAGESGTAEGIWMAGRTGITVIAIDYGMPPEHPFPAGMDDAIKVWKELVRTVPPANIGLFGGSAGGGMALAIVQRLKKEGAPLPAALVSATPWSDLSKTGDSYYINAGVDNGLGAYESLLEAAAKLYADGRDLKDPLISPVYGDFAGFPPTFLATGTRDLFLSNTVRVHRKLRQAGVESELEVFEGLSHGQFLYVEAPETMDFYASVGRFLDKHLGKL